MSTAIITSIISATSIILGSLVGALCSFLINKNINENKNISLTYETKSIIPMQKNKFTKVITNSIIKDFSNQF